MNHFLLLANRRRARRLQQEDLREKNTQMPGLRDRRVFGADAQS